nr:MAG TPA: hypothetical protein [Caudoviricetes sp.]
MKFLKITVKAAVGCVAALLVVGSDSIMDTYGIAGYLSIGACILTAFWLVCLDHVVSPKAGRRYRGRGY